MSKRTRPHKRSQVKKAEKRKTQRGLFSRYSSRAKIVAALIVAVLLAAASVVYWKVPSEKVAPAPYRSEAMNKAVVKNVSTLSASELADIPPEAFTRQPPADVGYNAHSGGLPPGALPPGVVLPGMSMTQGGQGYGGYDGVRQQFTSKERDKETGLDYFSARYYSSTQGRFTSPDEFKGGPQALWVLGSGDPEKQALVYADITNPQSLNKYQYTFNNPLRYVDPDGQAPQDSFDNKINQLIRQQLKGEITEKQYRESLRGPAVGTAAGLAIIVAARGGAPILTALARWATQNPDKVQQIAQAMQEGAGGPPGLALGPSSRLTAAETSTGGRLAKQLGVRLEESAHVGAEYVVAGANKTIDAMGGAQAYQHFGSGSKFFESIVHHVNKSVDYVAVDLAGASKSQVKAVQKFVGGLSEEQRKKIVYVQ